MSKELTSRYIYVYRDKFRKVTWGATNMRKLEQKSGISYGKLRYWFEQQNDGKGTDEVEFDAFRITRLSVSMIFNKNDP